MHVDALYPWLIVEVLFLPLCSFHGLKEKESCATPASLIEHGPRLYRYAAGGFVGVAVHCVSLTICNRARWLIAFVAFCVR